MAFDSYEIVLYPTPEQEELLAETLRLCEETFTWAVEARQDTQRRGALLSNTELSKRLTRRKLRLPCLKTVYSSVLQNVLYQVYKCGLRRAKGKYQFEGNFKYPTTAGHRTDGHNLRMSKIGGIAFVGKLPSIQATSVEVHRTGPGWKAVLLYKTETPRRAARWIGTCAVCGFGYTKNELIVKGKRGWRHAEPCTCECCGVPLKAGCSCGPCPNECGEITTDGSTCSRGCALAFFGGCGGCGMIDEIGEECMCYELNEGEGEPD